ncbi:DUF6057 family protein [Bacteroides fragilis]|nr:DUF6057 family protein [Bacteroides fragilis]
MKRLPHLLFALLFIIYFLCYQGVLSHVIYYHEQHHLFLFSKEYFLKQIHTEGLLSYLTDFIIQFFYMPALGKCYISRYIGGNLSVDTLQHKKITGQPDILQLSLIPSVSLFIYTLPVDHSLTLIIGAFLGLLILGCIAFFISGIWKNITLHRINVPGKKKK